MSSIEETPTGSPEIDPQWVAGLRALQAEEAIQWKGHEFDEDGWHEDAEAAMGWLASRGIAAPRIVLVGVSLGAGLALPLATRHAVRGLILESAFTSLADAASGHYPFLPVRLLLRQIG